MIQSNFLPLHVGVASIPIKVVTIGRKQYTVLDDIRVFVWGYCRILSNMETTYQLFHTCSSYYCLSLFCPPCYKVQFHSLVLVHLEMLSVARVLGLKSRDISLQ